MSAEGTNKSKTSRANENFEAEERQEQDATIRKGRHPAAFIAALKGG
jgi:hypothetical protein